MINSRISDIFSSEHSLPTIGAGCGLTKENNACLVLNYTAQRVVLKAIANGLHVKRRGDSIKKTKETSKRDEIGNGENGSKIQCVLRTLCFMNTEL